MEKEFVYTGVKFIFNVALNFRESFLGKRAKNSLDGNVGKLNSLVCFHENSEEIYMVENQKLLTVLIAAVLYMIIGMVWYSKYLFGPAWLKLCGMKESEMKKNKQAILWGFINALVIAYFLAFFEDYLGVTTVSDGMFVGFCVWLGFVATTQISAVIWCATPFRLFMINTGAKLLSLLVMGGVIGA